MADTVTGRPRSTRTLCLGVSVLALAIAGVASPASARPGAKQRKEPTAAPQTGPATAPDTSQAATDGTGDPQAGATDIVVTGRRAALENADERKRRSETIIDSIVADDAGRLPDNSVTEVLQRVSGVSIVRFAALGDPDHFSVQGSGVQVRGLSGVASRLNGREIFSANGGRALLWGDVTPELMAAVDVYKASTADLIEGGTGGQIDLRTKLPFDYRDDKFHVAATGELSMGDLVQKADPAGSVLVAKRWRTGIGDIGVLADVAWSQFSSLSQFFRMQPYLRTRIGANDYFIPGGYTYGDEEFRRRRTGIYGAVQWAPSNALTFTGTFFQSRYRNRSSDYGAFVTSNTLAVDPATSQFDEIGGLVKSGAVFVRNPQTFQQNGVITSGGNKGFLTSNTVTRDYALSFAWTPSGSPLAIRGALQRVDSTSLSDSLSVFRDLQFPGTFGLDLTGKLPQVTVPQGAQAAFGNPASYFWTASMPHRENNKGRLDTAQLDAEYSFDDDGFFRSVKVGGRYADRSERDFNNGYDWAALGRGWNGDPQLSFANAAPGDIELHAFKDFFRGAANLPGVLYFPSYDLVSRLDRAELTRSPPAGFCTAAQQNDCSASGPLPRTGYGGAGSINRIGFKLPDDRTDYSTKTWAGYGLVRFGRPDGISGNVGARVVHLENSSSGYYQQNVFTFVRNGQTVRTAATAGVRSGGASFTRVLPSVNIDYTPSSRTKLRFAYNITMDNAAFVPLRASGSLGVQTTTNPASTPTNNLPGLFTNFTTSSGNPRLKPTMSNNLDLSFEYYAGKGTTFHLAPFYKRVTNLPIYSLAQQPVTVVFANGTSEATTAASTDYVNAPRAATIRGVELGGRTFFDMLPGWLAGFGVEANYTFIDSRNPGDIYRDIDGRTRSDASVVGLSKHNANATLLYERNPFSARIAYSWRSRYLQTTNANGTNSAYDFYTAADRFTSIQTALPVYGSSYGQLDAGVRFLVTKNFSFNIQGTNLTNATQRTLMGGYPGQKLYTRSWFQSDRRIVTGINLAF